MTDPMAMSRAICQVLPEFAEVPSYWDVSKQIHYYRYPEIARLLDLGNPSVYLYRTIPEARVLKRKESGSARLVPYIAEADLFRLFRYLYKHPIAERVYVWLVDSAYQLHGHG
jgi:hypothetical protein